MPRCQVPARTIANALRDICKKILIERSLVQVARVIGTSFPFLSSQHLLHLHLHLHLVHQVKLLGRGTFGEAWLVTSRVTNRFAIFTEIWRFGDLEILSVSC